MKNNLRIAYIEDEPDIRQLATMALEIVGGFTVKAYPSGIEALKDITNFNPNLLLLDVMMPEMDGPTTLENIRKLEDWNPVPIVFMTAKVQPQEISHLLSLGASEVISKPFDPMTLAEKIGLIWEQWNDLKSLE